MFNAISLSPFITLPNTRSPTRIEGKCQLDETAEEYQFQITICFEGRCAFQGVLHIKDQDKTCPVELQFPLFSKRRLASVLQKKQYQVRLASNIKDEFILLLFCEKLMNDARKYITEFNKENVLESSCPSLINREANCLAEDREVKQQFLLFLIKCSGRNRIEKEPYFREFSAQALSGAPNASINAMAILIRMRYSFYDEDLRGVNLSQANLEGAMLYGAKLKGGNLERTRLHRTCLHLADLKEARMSQIDTGRKPSILMPFGIKEWDTSPNEHLLAMSTNDGSLAIWDLKKDIQSASIESRAVAKKHLNGSATYSSSLMKVFHIKFLKFIDDHLILVSDSFGFLGLWSAADLTLLSASPTIFGNPKLIPVKEIIKNSNSPSSYLSVFQNFCCYKESSSPIQEGSNDTYHFLMNLLGYYNGYKLFVQTGKIVENTIKISKSLLSSLQSEINDSHEPIVYMHNDTNAFFSLSPSGWIAGLTHDKKNQTMLELKLTKNNQKVAFLSEEEICKLNFTADDLWVIGIIKTPSTTKVVQWSTDHLYLQTALHEDILPIPEYQELFQIPGEIRQFELLLNKSYCVYAVDPHSFIQIRNLNTHKVVYHVAINSLDSFKLLPQTGLLLVKSHYESHFEVRKVELTISDFPNPDYEGSCYMFFTQDSRYLITHPISSSIQKCLRGEETLSQIAYEVRPYLHSLKKCFDSLPERQFGFEEGFYSPLFKYAMFRNSNMFYLWNIEKKQGVNLFNERSRYAWPRLHLFEKENPISFLFKWATSEDLSDDPFFAMAYKNRVNVIDLRDPFTPQNVLKIEVSERVNWVRLSKNNSQDRALFYSAKNKIVCRYYGVEKTKLYFKGHTREVVSFDTSYDNRLLISTGEDWTLRLWDILTGEQLDLINTFNVHWNPQFAPNDRFIVTYNFQESAAYLWEVKELKLKLLSITPKELGCYRANFENVMDLDEENKKLFKQLKGLNIS